MRLSCLRKGMQGLELQSAHLVSSQTSNHIPSDCGSVTSLGVKKCKKNYIRFDVLKFGMTDVADTVSYIHKVLNCNVQWWLTQAIPSFLD
jgi:hypothetical protein